MGLVTNKKDSQVSPSLSIQRTVTLIQTQATRQR